MASTYADASKPESLDFYIHMRHLQRPAFHCEALKKPYFSYLIHYLHRINLFSCWEITMHGVSQQVFIETLNIDNFYAWNLSLIFAICSETLTRNWFLTSCPQPAAMPSRSLLSECCSFHPAVGFLVLSPCGCKEKIKMWVKLSTTAFPLQNLFFIQHILQPVIY